MHGGIWVNVQPQQGASDGHSLSLVPFGIDWATADVAKVAAAMAATVKDRPTMFAGKVMLCR